MTTPAIRNTLSGRVHLDSGVRRNYQCIGTATVAIASCGREVEHWEPTTWEKAAKRRCKVCAKHAPIETTTEQEPIKEGQA